MVINIHFDNIIYQLQKAGGISTYWREITSRIAKHPNFSCRQTIGSKLTRYLPIYSNADIFHSSYYRTTFLSKAKKVVTIHDFLYQLGFIKTLGSSINIRQIKLAIEAADAIICVSENTKKDLLLLYPEITDHPNIYVVPHGSSLKKNTNESLSTSEQLYRISQDVLQRYILFIGKRISYKNFNSALMAFYESRLPKLGYVMVCIGGKFSDLEEELIASLGLTNNVLVLENITNEELNYLYQNAFALVYPSLYEGFGLPPLEAMSCGCPVIAANNSSLPEVVGDAGILVDAKNISAISNALEQLLDTNLRNTYITKGLARAKLFSWDKSAQKHIQIYQSLINHH